jgi:cation diffusion facilitator CzcD-associated flavoprotein CzcO
MVGQAATAIPPTESVPIEQQKTTLDSANLGQTNGAPPELSSAAAQAGLKVQQKYDEERQKRIRPDGDAQYVDLAVSEQFKHYREDPWLDERSEAITIRNGEHIKYFILGAGFGGLVYAVKLIRSGVPASEIRIVDSAGGFGGTWYYNRFPGLMCDIESYCYLPLLEEMNYMPKHKYSYGYEIREYINTIAEKYELSKTAMFRTKINHLVWDESGNEWQVDMTKERTSDSPLNLNITAQFVISTSGLLLHPKLPAISGLNNFKGTSFHTSRWDYSVTGGSPEKPVLDRLSDKRVGIIGTGATAIQAVPHLAKSAKSLTIFQRTPSSVDERGQHQTEKATWSTRIASKPGWWKERNLNLAAHLSGAVGPDETNLVNDEWAKCRASRALVGGPNPPLSMEDIPRFVASLYATDLPRAERLRQRVDDIVSNKDTAHALKHWYGSWCKRPTFHDDYLPVFNLPNVQLVDTDGKGVDALTATSAVVGPNEYPLDILIFSTGFRAPGIGSPAFRAGMTITGRAGQDMDAKWSDKVATLHGTMTHGFPNLFMPGPFQAGATANQNFTHDIMSNHAVEIMRQAQARFPGQKVVIEPTVEAEESWSAEIVKRSLAFAAMAGCTPSYLNGEGIMDRLPVEVKMKAARMGIWGEGIQDFMNTLEAWERKADLAGLEVRPA